MALRASPTRALIFPVSVSSKASRYSCFQLAGDAFPAAILPVGPPLQDLDSKGYVKNQSFGPVSFDRGGHRRAYIGRLFAFPFIDEFLIGKWPC